MDVHVEPLNGGLCETLDPTQLATGVLAAARNLVYKPRSNAVYRAPGRTKTTGWGSDPVVGMVDCTFDNGNQYLIAHAGTSYMRGSINAYGIPNATATIDTVSEGTTLDAAHFNNKWYLFNGANAGRVLKDDGTTRRHGLLAVTTSPTLASATGSAFSVNATGYYEYWTTEVVKYSDTDVVESTFAGDPTTIFVGNAATTYVTVKPPTQVNSEATHFRVYRSGAKTLATDKEFPVGVFVAELAFPSSGSALPTYTDGGTPTGTSFVSPVSVDVADKWTNESNVESWETTSETAAHLVKSDAGTNQWAFLAYNFSWPGLGTSNITGIEINVRAKASNGIQTILGAAIGKRSSLLRFNLLPPTVQHPGGLDPNVCPDPAGITPDGIAMLDSATRKNISATLTSSYVTYTLGSSTDDWLPSDYNWTVSDFDSTFGVMLIGGFRSGASSSDTLDIAGVQVKVYTTAGVTTITPFDAIVLNVGGVTSSCGANGAPPISRFGDVFEGSLCVNDVTNPSLLRYSLPDNPEAFPGLYFIDFESPQNDQMTAIKALGNKLIVGFRGSIYRVDYLPNEDDASYSRGRAYAPISMERGIVNEKACCVFTTATGQQLLAFVDATGGILATDGYSIVEPTADLDWREIVRAVNEDQGSSIFSPGCVRLDNHTGFSALILSIREGIGSTAYSYHLNYHPTHVRNGAYKLGGRIADNNSTETETYTSPGSSLVVKSSNGMVRLYLGYEDGTIWYVDTVAPFDGSDIPYTNGGGAPELQYMSATTRVLQPYGPGSEYEVKRIQLYSTGIEINGTSLSITTAYTNSAVVDTASVTLIDDTILARVDLNMKVVYGSVTILSPSSAAQRLYDLTLWTQSQGAKDA